MRVELNRVDNDFHFEATGSSGIPINIDGAVEIGGHNLGARPMELLLMGLGGCSAIDIINILKKQKQLIDKFRIVIGAEREKNEVPSIFETINVTFYLTGDLEHSKVERAVNLSMEKYCSAAAVIGKTAEIKYSFVVNQQKGEK